MDKFSIVENGYSKEEVNNFFDKLIARFEQMVNEINTKNETISTLKKEKATLLNSSANIQNLEAENKRLQERLNQYRQMEETLNKAIMMAQKTADQMRVVARDEAESITTEARNNANRIINDALIKNERVQSETDTLRRNLIVFKKRLKGVIETQLDVVEDIDKIDL
ncbi:MAG: DivIVA domain-containing protein [Bacilli bacterium]|nr:DivIVA domain-containing protein [Bacilli bacterium]